MVVYQGYIHLTPLQNKPAGSYVRAFKSAVKFFTDLHHPLPKLVTDNESSQLLEAYFASVPLPVQYAIRPPR